jgi:hypothetical protein
MKESFMEWTPKHERGWNLATVELWRRFTREVKREVGKERKTYDTAY